MRKGADGGENFHPTRGSVDKKERNKEEAFARQEKTARGVSLLLDPVVRVSGEIMN